MKPCLRCGRQLETTAGGSVVACVCGVEYAAELVEATDADTWLAMFAEDGYELHDDGDTILITRMR